MVDESKSDSDLEELEQETERERQMLDVENQMIAAMENQMSELSRSDMVHSAPESSQNGNEEVQ